MPGRIRGRRTVSNASALDSVLRERWGVKHDSVVLQRLRRHIADTSVRATGGDDPVVDEV